MIAPSELIINPDGSCFHLHLKPEQLADKIIMVGDPDRVNTVASYFDTKECEVSSREFHTITGTYKGKRITTLSHGIGTDNIDIVLNEGKSIGFDGVLYFYADSEKVRDKAFESELMRQLKWKLSGIQPYVVSADPSLVKQITQDDIIRGVTIAANGFYGPQGRKLRLPLADPELNRKIEAFEFNDSRITNFEMESSSLAGLSALMGHRAMTVCCIIAGRVAQDMNTEYKGSMTGLIETVLDRI